MYCTIRGHSAWYPWRIISKWAWYQRLYLEVPSTTLDILDIRANFLPISDIQPSAVRVHFRVCVHVQVHQSKDRLRHYVGYQSKLFTDIWYPTFSCPCPFPCRCPCPSSSIKGPSPPLCWISEQTFYRYLISNLQLSVSISVSVSMSKFINQRTDSDIMLDIRANFLPISDIQPSAVSVHFRVGVHVQVHQSKDRVRHYVGYQSKLFTDIWYPTFSCPCPFPCPCPCPSSSIKGPSPTLCWISEQTFYRYLISNLQLSVSISVSMSMSMFMSIFVHATWSWKQTRTCLMNLDMNTDTYTRLDTENGHRQGHGHGHDQTKDTEMAIWKCYIGYKTQMSTSCLVRYRN
jgi:hypothetical protein